MFLNFLFVLLFCISIGFADETYENKYDNIDLDEVLLNERLLKNYVKCLLDEGPCSPDGQELKNSLPDAIQSECSKCTEKQKIGSEKVTHFLIDNKPEEWEKLAKLYDSKDEYRSAYLAGKTSEENDKENESSTEA